MVTNKYKYHVTDKIISYLFQLLIAIFTKLPIKRPDRYCVEMRISKDGNECGHTVWVSLRKEVGIRDCGRHRI